MKIATWLTIAALLGGTAIAAPPTQLEAEAGPAPAIDSTTRADELAIGRDGRDRMTVDVSVGGRGPYRFLVDTGSERTVISRQLAARLQLASGRGALVHSVLGRNDVNTVNIPRLQFSNSTVSVLDAPALDAANIGADGLLGIDSLRSQRVLFDFKAGTMSIIPSARPVEKLDGDIIVVRAKTRKGRLIFTQARLGGRKVAVIIDTGSQLTIGNLALHRQLHRGAAARSEPVTIETITGEKLTANLASLRKLELGGIHLDDLNVAFADAHIFRQLNLDDQPALLLGMNALRAFDRISIDFKSKKVRFVLPGTSMRDQLRVAAVGGL